LFELDRFRLLTWLADEISFSFVASVASSVNTRRVSRKKRLGFRLGSLRPQA
jgi:hypothetical protein